jgi:glycine/D-amino acid oxidase-like deaminating enzyme
MAGRDDSYEKASLPHLRAAGLPFEELPASEAARRFPQVNFEGAAWVLFEREAGYLFARRACQAVLDGFVAEGGEYRQVAVEPGPIEGGALGGLRLSDDSRLAADRYVFACGPWLGRLFPDVVGGRVAPTRQEVHFFGPPAGDTRYLEDRLPVWIDNGALPGAGGGPGGPLFYGIPGDGRRGFKIADDTRGPAFDPTGDDRLPTRSGVRAARDYLAFRFPGLKDAPLLEARVCQYENSPDGRFILDRHPGAANVVLLGGGSGHGFKHGPAVGERAAALALGEGAPDPFFALARFVA